MSSVQLAFIALAALFQLRAGAQVVQDDWVSPALPDFATSILLNSTYTITWTHDLQSWFPEYAPSANVSNVDLWIQSTTSSDDVLIQTGIDVTKTYSVEWVVLVPVELLTMSTRWTFQFRPAGEDEAGEEISSPQVILRNVPFHSETTMLDDIPTSPSTVASTGPSGSTPGIDFSQNSSTSTSSPGLSGGAIAGIVIGTLAVIVLAVGIFIFWRRRKGQPPQEIRQVYPDAPISWPTPTGPIPSEPTGNFKVELPNNEIHQR